MDRNIPIFPARYYLKVIELLQQRGIAVAEILVESGLPIQKILQDEDAKLSISQVERFVELCLKYSQNADLAFELGSTLKLSSHSLVGYVAMTSETARQAIELIAQYFKLIIPNFQLKIRESETQVFLSFEPSMPMSTLNVNFHLEAIAIAFYHNLIELLGRNHPPYHVYLSIAQPRHLQKYQQLDRVTFHFQHLIQTGIQFVLPITTLDIRLPMADIYSLKIVEQRCQELMKQLSDSDEMEAWIRMMLQEAYHIPTLAECSKLLNLSTKTVQRYLKKHGQDFHSMRMQIIIERAKTALTETDKSITEIADELGYSTSANFIRAFKTEMQMTPTQYREQNTLHNQ